MRVRKSFGVTFLFFTFLAAVAFAQESRLVGTEGVHGEELVCLALSPVDENVVFLGTARGLYAKNLAKQDPWKPVPGLPLEGCRVNQIIFGEHVANSLVATGKGLFVFKADGQGVERIFTRSDNFEGNCLSAAALDNGTILAGTQAGLFIKKIKENHWQKIVSPFDKDPVLYLHGSGNRIYAAVSNGIYRSQDSGKRWERVFCAQDYRENDGDGGEAESGEDEQGVYGLRSMLGIEDPHSVLYAVMNQGIFITEDGGKKWNALASPGMDSVQLRYLFAEAGSGHLFAAHKTGIYEYQSKEWRLLNAAYDCLQGVRRKTDIIFITRRDVFQYVFDYEKNTSLSPDSKDGLFKKFEQEPSIQEVQDMAIAYCEVSDKKIINWRRRARMKAFMPEVSLDYDKTVTTALGATYDKVQVGPMDWGVSLKWDLGDLVYNSDETSIDSRSKLMVELRNDVLAEVTRLYFERRKLQTEIMRNNFGEKGVMDRNLRLMELSAMIDRLTGGNFTKVLKSTE